jgi:hypothetical protein
MRGMRGGTCPRCKVRHTLAGRGSRSGETGERRYPSTLRGWIPFLTRTARGVGRIPEKTEENCSCSYLYSQKKLVLTQSSPATARKIRPGGAQVCWRGAQG